ncbi:MAG: PrpR N-terminal domain-containing protein [Lawsonibacter sp.]|nr:PrpR N-terminal domain-containing protein [Lawsonibacter sp.]
MKKLRLLCIPPYEGMYNLMTNIAAQRSDVELIIHMGNLEDGLQAVLENRDNNIDAVISRGGTAETIRAHCGDIPACDIIPSVYDVLRTIRLAQSMSEKLAVVGFPSITKPADMLRDIMQYDFKVRTIHSSTECEACLQSLRSEGIQVIAGDMISVTCAQRLGMHGLLIVSGIESVEATIDSAVEMHRYYSAIRKRAALFSDLLNSNESDLIIYNSDGQEYFSTISSLSQDLQLLLQQKISNVIAQGSVKIVRHVDGSILSIKGRLLQSGGEDYCVYTLSSLSNVAMFDKYMIHCLSADNDLPDCYPLEYYLGNSEEIVSIHNACDRYASMSNSIIILGDRGTGKDRFAHYIYSRSRLKHSSFVVIDVGLLDDKGWDFLLQSDNSPLTDSGLSIYFKRINTATPAQQQQFLIYLKNSCAAQANRLFFSYTVAHGGEPQGELYLYLTETMRCLRLHLPTLAQRRTDIPTLVGLYINAINVQHGTRVVGLTHDAMLALQTYNWTRNVDQLVQTVRDLVINARTSYISEDQVQMLLAQDKQKPTAPLANSIDLDRPLDQIIRDVVLRVYESENLNQTHTARRLGISRSTLWRMMK